MNTSLQEDIIALRNFKQKHNLEILVVHPYTLDEYPLVFMEKLIRGCVLSYQLGDYASGMFPIITDNNLYLVEHPTDGEEVLEMIDHYKSKVESISKKLNTSFADKAPKDVVDLERKKLKDFNQKWEWATIGYLYV